MCDCVCLYQIGILLHDESPFYSIFKAFQAWSFILLNQLHFIIFCDHITKALNTFWTHSVARLAVWHDFVATCLHYLINGWLCCFLDRRMLSHEPYAYTYVLWAARIATVKLALYWVRGYCQALSLFINSLGLLSCVSVTMPQAHQLCWFFVNNICCCQL